MNHLGGGSETGLVFRLEVPEVGIVGLPLLVTIRAINGGKQPITISSRLNLMEGDVRMMLTAPDGANRVIAGAGGQPDTALRQVKLLPGQEVVGSINLLYTDAGTTFPVPGKYGLQAEFAPSPQMGWITSEPASLTIRSPQDEAERDVARLLQTDEAKRALTLAEADGAPDELRELGARHSDTLAGTLARLVLAGGEDPEATADSNNVFQKMNPMTAASRIKAVCTPFSSVGKRLTKGFADHVESQGETSQEVDSGGSTNAQRALKILKEQAIESD